MGRIKMVIEYDGSNYHGFQIQQNAHTIQAEMEKGILNLTGEKSNLMFAGRTDAGVHALGQVVAFDTNSSIPPDKWRFALNSFLPQDIKIVRSEEAAPDFHPRFHALKKHYRYMIYRQSEGTVFYRHYALCNDEILDIGGMKQACQYIKGVHDFRSFCASGSSSRNFEREVNECAIIEEGPFIKLEIEANGFLYNMVRIICGTLLNVGRGIYKPEQIAEVIAAKDRSLAGATAPPQGLYLVSVTYPERI